MLSPTTVSRGENHHRSVRNVRAEILARCPCPVSVLVLIAVPRSLGGAPGPRRRRQASVAAGAPVCHPVPRAGHRPGREVGHTEEGGSPARPLARSRSCAKMPGWPEPGQTRPGRRHPVTGTPCSGSATAPSRPRPGSGFSSRPARTCPAAWTCATSPAGWLAAWCRSWPTWCTSTWWRACSTRARGGRGQHDPVPGRQRGRRRPGGVVPPGRVGGLPDRQRGGGRAQRRDRAGRRRAAGRPDRLFVPLRARGRVLGVVRLVRGSGGSTYHAADVALAEEIAARAALALDNVRLYDEARATAVALQRSLLPGVAATGHRRGHRAPLPARAAGTSASAATGSTSSRSPAAGWPS